MAVQTYSLLEQTGDEAENVRLWSAASLSAAPQLSILIPTRNEAGNVEPLLGRLCNTLDALRVEIIFVDDSDDDTPSRIQVLGATAPQQVSMIHRPPGKRGGGLGSAVVAGLRKARSPWVCVMDADLQHPPELIPELLEKAEAEGSDLVLASRLSEPENAMALGRFRLQVSRSLTAAARLAFPSSLRRVSDPLTGFFLLRKDAVELETLRPNGFKILLEILVRFPRLRVAEVPFVFGTRFSGQSKASAGELARYCSLLMQLRFNGSPRRFMRFAAVGASGILVNLLLHAFITDVMGIFYLTAAVLATQGSSLWNFALTEAWVFEERRGSERRWRRLVLFLLMNNAAFLLRGPIMYVLTSLFGMHYLLSNLISLVLLTLLRFVLADRLIWGRDPRSPNDPLVADTSRPQHAR